MLIVFLFWCYCTFVPPRVKVRATVKLSAVFFHDESSITIWGGGYKSAIAPLFHVLILSTLFLVKPTNFDFTNAFDFMG